MAIILILIALSGSSIVLYEPEPACHDVVDCEVDGISEPTINKFDIKIPATPASYTNDK